MFKDPAMNVAGCKMFVFNSVVPVCRVYGGTEFVCHRLPWRRYRYISGNNADSVNGSLIRGRFTTAYAC